MGVSGKQFKSSRGAIKCIINASEIDRDVRDNAARFVQNSLVI